MRVKMGKEVEQGALTGSTLADPGAPAACDPEGGAGSPDK